MRVVKYLTLGLALVALIPSGASAQDKSVFLNVGGGPTFAGGDLGEVFETGWGPTFGVTVGKPRIGFQFEYSYKWFEIEDYEDSQLGVFSANHKTHMLNFNMLASLNNPDSAARVFMMVGPGAYYRSVEITEYIGSGVICDPNLYLCGTYPVSDVVGSRGGWDFGINFGAGVGFKIGRHAEFTIESKYHFVAGPEVDPDVNPLTDTPRNANGFYYPLTFGFRF